MHIFARCGQACTLTLKVPADGSFADVRAALLSKRPKLAACDDLVGLTLNKLSWSGLLHNSCSSQTSIDVVRLQAFTFGGRFCEDSTSLAAACVQRDCTVDVQRRLRGGGGDGGATGAESRVSYLEMYMSKKPDKVCSALPVPPCDMFGSEAAVQALYKPARICSMLM